MGLMAVHAERAFIQHLCIPTSLKDIVDRDLPEDLMPTDELNVIFRFAIDYWHAEGADSIAPTEGVLRTHFDNLLNEQEIDLSIEPEAILDWSIEVLRGLYINRNWQPWVRKFAAEIGSPDVDPLSKAKKLTAAIGDLMEMEALFTRRSEHFILNRDIGAVVRDYELRVEAGGLGVQGIRFGMPMIDEHTGGIRDGEIGVLGGVPKAGKSFMGLWAAYQTWLAGGDPVLMSLENQMPMTTNRLCCMMAGVDSHAWDRGECNEMEMERVRQWQHTMELNERPFHILSPEPGKRTFNHLIRKAKTLGDSIIIDQLPWVEIIPGTERKSRDQQIRDMMHQAAELLNTGRHMPMMLIHQINREGQKLAEKTGHLEMYHLAEAAEIERTATHVWGLWQSRGMRDAGSGWLQGLAARRYALLHYDMTWIPHRGLIAARGPIQLPEAA